MVYREHLAQLSGEKKDAGKKASLPDGASENYQEFGSAAAGAGLDVIEEMSGDGDATQTISQSVVTTSI